MMSNDKTGVIALSVAVVALGLSAYSALGVYSAPSSESGGFEPKVMAVIDKYVEEKQKEAAGPPVPTEPVDVSADDDPMQGDKDAPVTIVEFTDYQCPYCGRFYTDTYGLLKEKYIDTGKVKYVVRDFPLSFHPNAKPAANAAECVREQTDDTTYFAYHDLLFKNQTALSPDDLKGYAGQLGGVNIEKLSKCMESQKYYSEIDADMTEGQGYGITGTPGFFVNGRMLVGAQPYTSFETLIEEELAK